MDGAELGRRGAGAGLGGGLLLLSALLPRAGWESKSFRTQRMPAQQRLFPLSLRAKRVLLGSCPEKPWRCRPKGLRNHPGPSRAMQASGASVSTYGVGLCVWETVCSVLLSLFQR